MDPRLLKTRFSTQGIGVTATLPDGVPVKLYGRVSGPTDWYYVDSSLYQNVQSGLADLSSLEVNQKVGVLLSADGYLHVYLDGQHIREAASGLPVNQQLVDVYGRCTKIKSELLRGESDIHAGPAIVVKPTIVLSCEILLVAANCTCAKCSQRLGLCIETPRSPVHQSQCIHHTHA